MLAGISVEYYTRLERGNATGVSEDVLEGIARALQLDEAERAHLLDLFRTAGAARPARRRPTQERVRTTVQRVVDSMIGTPAFVLNGRLDILTANALGRALYSPTYADPTTPPNNARFVFLDPHANEFFRDWGKVANDTVALLRAEAGHDPYDRRLSDLIGELSTRSEEFRVRWAARGRRCGSGLPPPRAPGAARRRRRPVGGDAPGSFARAPIPSASRLPPSSARPLDSRPPRVSLHPRHPALSLRLVVSRWCDRR